MITKGMVDEKLSSQVIFLDEKRRKRRGWGDRDGDTPLAVLKERSSKEDRYQFTQVSWAASAFSLNIVCCLLGLSKENFFLPFVWFLLP